MLCYQHGGFPHGNPGSSSRNNLFSLGQIRMFKFTGNLWPFCPFCILLGYFKHTSYGDAEFMTNVSVTKGSPEGERKIQITVLLFHINMDILLAFVCLFLCSPQLSIKKKQQQQQGNKDQKEQKSVYIWTKVYNGNNCNKSSQKHQQHTVWTKILKTLHRESEWVWAQSKVWRTWGEKTIRPSNESGSPTSFVLSTFHWSVLELSRGPERKELRKEGSKEWMKEGRKEDGGEIGKLRTLRQTMRKNNEVKKRTNTGEWLEWKDAVELTMKMWFLHNLAIKKLLFIFVFFLPAFTKSLSESFHHQSKN